MQHGRLYYLDALRSFCMLYGVFVHTGAFLGKGGLWQISFASEFFRMGTFFLVSGFLVALVAARTSVPSVLRRRSVALLVPLATLVILVNPVTCWLIHLRHAGPMPLSEFLFGGGWRAPTGGDASWLLHLWFLVALWVYVMLFPVMAWVAALPPVRRGLDALGRRPTEIVVPAVAVAVALAVAGLRGAGEIALGPLVEGTRLDWVTSATIAYLPYFALGVLMHASRGFFERMHGVSVAGLGLGLAFGLGLAGFGDALPRSVGTLAEAMARATLTIAIVASLLWLARATVSTRSRLLGVLTETIYTVYLFHYVAIYALGLLLLRFVPAGPVYYLVLSPAVILLLVGFHHFVVARSPLLRLLLNGRPMPAADRVAAG